MTDLLSGYRFKLNGDLEIDLPMEVSVTINTASNQSLIIDKVFGPWAVYPIRIILNPERAGWVVERSYCLKEENGDYSDLIWKEAAFIPGWPDEVKLDD